MKISDMKAAEKAEEQESQADVLEIVEGVDAPALFEGKDAAKKIVKRIREHALALVTDAQTPKGRKEIKSLAYGVARCKTTLDGLGKEMVADLKKRAASVDSVRKMIRDELDSTKEAVLQPVTDWEARVRAVEERINKFRDLADIRLGESVVQLNRRLDELSEIEGEEINAMGRENDLADEAAAARKIIDAAIAERVKYEAEQAELARLREEAAKREAEDRKRAEEAARLEREAKIREEAEARAKAEAERRLAEAEDRAKTDKSNARIDADYTKKPDAAKSVDPYNRTVRQRIEDALMDEIVWMMPDKAADIAEVICSGVLPGVEVRA